MRAKLLLMLLGVLLVTPAALGFDPTIPLWWNGNNNGLLSENVAKLPFYRMAWCQWPDPVFPAITREYRCDRTSYRFTANNAGTVQAIQFYSRTPGDKMGQLDPTMTVSIQTDDGSGKPSGTPVGSWTGTWGVSVASQGGPVEYKDTLTAPVGAAVTAGNIYHVVVQCDSLTAPSVVASGADYANSAYDFRLTSSSGGNPVNNIRLYDGTVDSNLVSLYYNQTAGGAYENQWVVGAPKATDSYPDGHTDAQQRPLFEMFAGYDAQTGDVSSPIAGLAEGPALNLSPVVRKGVALDRTNGSGAAGEKIVAHYPTAAPVAKKARILMAKRGDPGTDLVIEVKDNTNTVVATATVAEADVPTSHTWVEVELSQDVPMVDGHTYYVVARYNDQVQIPEGNYYSLAMQEQRIIVLPTKENGYMGIESVFAESTDVGATWTEDDTVDAAFSLAVVIPGDANGDHNVNVGDLGILAANYGQSPRDWGTADFNGDTTVNVGDLGILAAHYGEHLPEPTTMGLLVFGGLALLRRRGK